AGPAARGTTRRPAPRPNGPRARRSNAARGRDARAPDRAIDAGRSTWRIAGDLAVMFLLASSLRALLSPGIALPGGFAAAAATGPALASATDNLPAAAVVHPAGGAAPWPAILAMSIGANLFLTGSVATVLCRRLAREAGAPFSLVRSALLGLTL